MLEDGWFEFSLLSQLGFGTALIDVENAATLALSAWIIDWDCFCLMHCLCMAKAPFFPFWWDQPLTWKYVLNWKNFNRLALPAVNIGSLNIIIAFSLITIWVLRVVGLKVGILRRSALQFFTYLVRFQLWRIFIEMVFCF